MSQHLFSLGMDRRRKKKKRNKRKSDLKEKTKTKKKRLTAREEAFRQNPAMIAMASSNYSNVDADVTKRVEQRKKSDKVGQSRMREINRV